MSAPFDVLVVSLRDGIGIARLPSTLRRAGCRVSVLCPKGAFPRSSRFVSRRFPLVRDPLAVGDALREHLERHDHDWVILGDDAVLKAVLDRRGEPWTAACLPTPRESPIADAIASKPAFLALADEEGWPVSEWVLCRTPEAVRGAAAAIGAEVMVKTPAGSGGSGVRAAGDPDAAEEFARELGVPLVVQRRLPGAVGLAVCLFDRGRLACWTAAYKERTYLGPFGPSAAHRFVDLPALGPVLERIGARLGYHGFAGVDFVHDHVTGAVTLIEFNGRPTPQIHLGRRVGADFAAAVARMLAGEEGACEPAPADAAGRYIPLFPEEMVRCLQEGDVRALAAWAVNPSWWLSIPVDDPILLVDLLGTFAFKWARGRGRLAGERSRPAAPEEATRRREAG